ncbi:MAG: hypothetical protein OXC39_02250 [Candidatus Dadabacteria bacterium]|nr:hypothetical protein [Candidatus Dadabacteria bacterium]
MPKGKPDNFEDSVENLVEDISERADKDRRAMRYLLDLLFEREDRLIAAPARMGDTHSYITSVSLKWVAANVHYARDLPLFKSYISEDNNRISINDTTRQYIQQREPDHSRQLPMTMYLATRKYHKFGPLILVAYKDWVYDEESDKWGLDDRALEASLSLESMDSNTYLVDLDVANTKYFALDGQHRLMAIKGLRDLLDGRLEAKSKDGTSRPKKAVTSDEIEEDYRRNGLSVDLFQGLLDERIGIEIIPAVQYGDTLKEAITRLRNIFVDVNENAKRLEEGELTLLDENHGFRIVARTILTNHELFQSGNSDLRVNMKTSNVTETSDDYTTLTTIVEISKQYLQCYDEFKSLANPILNNKEFGYMKPEDEIVDNSLKKLQEYFNALKDIPSHKEMVQGARVRDLRSREKNDNILFWPIAQMALAAALAKLQVEEEKSLTDLVAVIARHEAKGDLKLRSKVAPWFGVLCDPIEGKLRRKKSYQFLCAKMFFYLLGGKLQNDEREELLKGFFDARKIDDENAYALSGELSLEGDFCLPEPWQ